MDAIDSYFTETIIGKPILVTLGTPIRHDVEPSLISGAPTAAPVGTPRRLGNARRSMTVLGLGVLPAIAIGAIMLFMYPQLRDEKAGAETGPEAGTVAQVAPPATPASATAPEPEAAASAPEASLPIMAASSAAPASQSVSTGEIAPVPLSISISTAEFATETLSVAPAISVAPAKRATPRVQQPANRPSRPISEKVEKSASVIVDGAAPKAVNPAPAPVQAKAVPASPPSSAKSGTGKLVSPAVEVPASPAAVPARTDGPRVTLVDIDKTGAHVLITNPQTRLPQKVEVGQKIFTGETVLKIDPKAGRIHLDSGRVVTMQ